MNQPISSMMQRRVWVADIDDTVASVEQLLAEHELSWVPVQDDGRGVIGVISATDLLQFHASKRDAAAVRAWQVCAYKPLVVVPDTAVDEVARRMVERRLHHAVVMEGEAIKGVVSSLDFVLTFVTTANGQRPGSKP